MFKQVQPVELSLQEVLCQNCFDTIPMTQVDNHSRTCTKQRKALQSDNLEEHVSELN